MPEFMSIYLVTQCSQDIHFELFIFPQNAHKAFSSLLILCAFVAKESDHSRSTLLFAKTNFILNSGLSLNLWNSCRMESLSY